MKGWAFEMEFLFCCCAIPQIKSISWWFKIARKQLSDFGNFLFYMRILWIAAGMEWGTKYCSIHRLAFNYSNLIFSFWSPARLSRLVSFQQIAACTRITCLTRWTRVTEASLALRWEERECPINGRRRTAPADFERPKRNERNGLWTLVLERCTRIN